MSCWRTLAGLTLLLAAVPAIQARSYTLAEPIKPGDCFRVHLRMQLTGEMRFNRDGKAQRLALKADAEHEFPERVLAVGKSGVAEKTARVYEKARATIAAGPQHSERTLRPGRRLFVAQRFKDQPLVYCPAGPLYRPELELTSGHFDTLCLTGLLPGKAVAVGDTWKVSSSVAQALCHFEGLAEQDLTCKLEAVNDRDARVSVRGTARGIDVGAMVKMTVEASYRFDLSARRLVGLEWKQKDERDQGPASPASTVETTTTLSRASITQPAGLSDIALVSVPEGEAVPPQMTQLDHHDPKGRFDLLYTRQWHIVAQTDENLVLRLMDRGDFVAQVTVTPWTPAGPGKQLSPDEFRSAVNRTPGWQPERELQAGEVPSEKGRRCYRLSYQGKLDGVEVVQNFYLVTNEDGRQVVLAFTMTPRQAERLGARDLSLVGSLGFPKR